MPEDNQSMASDSDDDLPIKELIRKRLAAAAMEVSTKAKKVKVESQKKKDVPSSSSKTSKPTRSSSSTYSKIGSLSAEYYETTKGGMVQQLLCRWWYAWEWPKPDEKGSAPLGYEALDGFPGVYISTSSDSLGTIVDLRDKTNCPSLKNISTWSSAKIQETLLEALTKQMAELEEHEGNDIPLYRELKDIVRKVKSVNPTSADREAKKFVF